MKGDVNPSHLAYLPAPKTGAIDHVFRFDLSLIGDHTSNGIFFTEDSLDPDVFQNRCTTHPGTLSQSPGGIDGVCLPVFW